MNKVSIHERPGLLHHAGSFIKKTALGTALLSSAPVDWDTGTMELIP